MKDLFTLVITHYNQDNVIYTAIDSALKQDYPNIELLITDDGSKEFLKDKIAEYIEKNKNENIVHYDFIINEKNLGTVKTLNKAIKKAKGKYISFFAGDDELSNEHVISNYVDAFKKYDKDIITAQSYLYDEMLITCFGSYVDVEHAYKCNHMTPLDVFVEMSQQCFYASGATAYKMSLFAEYGLFDERYRLVEDWAYWLYILKKGVQIYYVDFPSLNHRDGGVSHNHEIELPSNVKIYYNDLLKVYEQEILLDMPNISKKKKYMIYKDVEKKMSYSARLLKINNWSHYNKLIQESINKNIGNDLSKIVYQDKIATFFKWHVYYKVKNLYKSNPVLVVTVILWLIVNIFMLKDFYVGLDTYETLFNMLKSLIIIMFATDLVNRIGDNMILCLPITTVLSYGIFSLFNICDITACLLLFIGTYVIIYYVLYVLRLILRKERAK